METKDMAIIGLVVLLVLAVVFSGDVAKITGKSILECSDSDGGSNYYVKGHLTGVDNSGNYGPGTKSLKEDFCGTDGLLYEYRCDIGQGQPGWQKTATPCPSGTICIDGACI